MKDDKIIEEALERFELCKEAHNENYLCMLDDLRFLALEQWDEQLKNARENDPDGARPCLVADKLNQYINQVINDMRESRPSPKYRPVDDYSDEEVADILQGVSRNILDKSSADIAIDTAFSHAVKGGIGFFRVITDYSDPMSFEQDIEVKRVENPLSVYLDPASVEPDGSDAKFGFVVEELSKEEFESQYPDAEPVDWEGGITDNDWIEKDQIRIVEYFYCVEKVEKIVQLSNGMVSRKVDVDESVDALMELGLEVINERETTTKQIKWCKMTAHEILESTDWAGQYIPIIPVYGNEENIAGKTIRSGLIRAAKDPQKAYNYAYNAFIERVALVPKSPYIAADGQIEQYEEIWNAANTSNIPVLPYTPMSVDGSPVPAPQRQMAADVPSGWLQVMQSSEHDIQAALGIYNAQLGQQSNEISGKAILARNKKGDNATMHFVDNLGRSIRHLGRILIDLIPAIYDTKRVLRIIGGDDSVQNVTFDPNQRQPVQEVQDMQGEIQKIYNPLIGKYDVATTIGASYATKREEAAEALSTMMQYYPQLMQLGGDIMVKNMDWAGAEELAERLERTIPPEIRGEDGQEQLPPQVQQALAEAAASIQELTQMNQQLQDMLFNKQKEEEQKDKELDLKAYDSETKRLKEIRDMMSPEQTNGVVNESADNLMTSPDISFTNM